MATDKKSSGGTSSSGGGGSGASDKPSVSSSSVSGSKRPVTIDLKAENKREKPGSSEPSAASSTASTPKAGSSAAKTPSSGGAKPGDASTTSTTTPPRSGSYSSGPTSGSSSSARSSSTVPKSGSGADAESMASTASSSTTNRPSSTGSSSRSPGSTTFSNPPAAEEKGGVGAFGVLIAAVIGGILVLGGGFGLHQAGILKLTPEPNRQMAQALTVAEKKISELESKLGDVIKSVSGQDGGAAVSALETKVSSLEEEIQNVSSATSSNTAPVIVALKKDIEALRSEVSASGSNSSSNVPVDLKPLESRLAALEAASRPQNTADLTTLETRLSKLESTSTSTSSESDKLTGSITSVEKQVADVKSALSDIQMQLQNTEATAKAAQTAVSTSDTSLKTLADSQAKTIDTVSSLSSDIQSVGAANSTALEDIRAELDSISKRIVQVESTMGDATAREVAARALSVSVLKSAVDSGQPYETELAAVKAGLPADMDLKALQSHAETGVEPVAVLIAQFPPVAREIYQTFSEPDNSGDVIGSLLASARSIVAVRGPGDADGTGPEAALRRMENAVSAGDLKSALASYKDLPEPAQTVASDWVARAKARVEVDTLTDKASQEVLNALAAKDS